MCPWCLLCRLLVCFFVRRAAVGVGVHARTPAPTPAAAAVGARTPAAAAASAAAITPSVPAITIPAPVRLAVMIPAPVRTAVSAARLTAIQAAAAVSAARSTAIQAAAAVSAARSTAILVAGSILANLARGRAWDGLAILASTASLAARRRHHCLYPQFQHVERHVLCGGVRHGWRGEEGGRRQERTVSARASLGPELAAKKERLISKLGCTNDLDEDSVMWYALDSCRNYGSDSGDLG